MRLLDDIVRGRLDAASAGPFPIHALDFSIPATQELPETSAALSALVGQTPDHIWKFNGTGDVTDLVGSADLSEVNSPLRQQTAMIWNGSDWTSNEAAEVRAGSSNGFDLGADTSTLDLGSSNSIAILCVVRCPTVPTTNYVLFEKRDNAFGAGYEMRLASTGYVLLAEDSVGTTHTAVISANTELYNGAWHWVLSVFDFTADQIRIYTDFASGTNSSVLDTGESWASTNALAFLAGPNRNSAEIQIAYAAAWTGAAAEAMTGVGTFWTHGDDATGKLTTATHASLFTYSCGDDSDSDLVQHWHGGGVHGTDQLPYCYDAGLTLGAGVGVGAFEPYTNLCTDSEDLSVNWVAGGSASISDNAADSPDGMRRASLLNGSFGSDYMDHPDITVTASTQYTFSSWLKLKDSASGTIRMRVRDSTTPLASNDATVTDKWARYTLTFTSGDTTAKLRIFSGDGSSALEDVYVWGVQLVAGNAPGPYARALGTSATVARTNHLGANLVPTALGGFAARGVIPTFKGTTEGNQTVLDIVGNPDRRSIYRDDGSGDANSQIRDGSSSVLGTLAVSDPFTAGVEFLAQHQWNDGAATTALLDVDGAQDSSGVLDLDPGAATRDLDAGGDANGSTMNGIISLVEIYGEEFIE